MTYGELLKKLIDSSGLSKTYICEALEVSRPYLYDIFSGETQPPVPEKQFQLIDLLKPDAALREKLLDLAALERNEPPADIAQFIRDPTLLKKIRAEYSTIILRGHND